MTTLLQEKSAPTVNKLPLWFRQDLPDIEKIKRIKDLLRKSNLKTVCESAHCPNMGECWRQNVATFMILGDRCTRGCRFCAVNIGRPLPVDFNEPRNVALAVKSLNLRYVVVTSVTRDDLDDRGSHHFVRTVYWMRQINPDTKIELLIPDFGGEKIYLQKVVESRPDVIGHNIEMVKRLFPRVRPQADYERSISVLGMIKNMDSNMLVKSGFMVGLGEAYEEVVSLMKGLISVGCDILTIGQYLAPSENERHVKVHEFIRPGVFTKYKQVAHKIGFRYVMAGPLVRSSYIAEKGYEQCIKGRGHAIK